MELDLLSAELITCFVPASIVALLVLCKIFEEKYLEKTIVVVASVTLIMIFINSDTTKLYNFIMQTIILILLMVIIFLMYSLIEKNKQKDKEQKKQGGDLK